jgi:exonuclease V
MEVDLIVPARPGTSNFPDAEEDYGDEIEYTDEFEAILQAAESRPKASEPAQDECIPGVLPAGDDLMDIEELPLASPFERFRRRGTLSVSDLVGTVWCEVQVCPPVGSADSSMTSTYWRVCTDSSRLRTLPYLAPSLRPAVIVSDKGKEIAVNKVKEEGREKIVRRGQVSCYACSLT